MPKLTLLCRNVTTFDEKGEIDEGAYREYLGRFIANGLGVYIGSAGAGQASLDPRLAPQRFLKLGDRFSAKAPIPSF